MGFASAVVTVSEKFQIVVPKDVRESMGIRPHEKLVMLEKGKQLILVPLVPVKTLRGTAPGLSWEDARDHSDRF